MYPETAVRTGQYSVVGEDICIAILEMLVGKANKNKFTS